MKIQYSRVPFSHPRLYYTRRTGMPKSIAHGWSGVPHGAQEGAVSLLLTGVRHFEAADAKSRTRDRLR